MNDVYTFVYKHEPSTEGRDRARERESTKKRFVLFSLRLHSVAEDRPLVMNAREENHSVQKKQLYPLKHSELSNNASFTRILTRIFLIN